LWSRVDRSVVPLARRRKLPAVPSPERSHQLRRRPHRPTRLSGRSAPCPTAEPIAGAARAPLRQRLARGVERIAVPDRLAWPHPGGGARGFAALLPPPAGSGRWRAARAGHKRQGCAGSRLRARGAAKTCRWSRCGAARYVIGFEDCACRPRRRGRARCQGTPPYFRRLAQRRLAQR